MIQRRFTLFPVLLVILGLASASCEKFSGSEEIPAYLSIDSIYLTTDYYEEGTASQRITDAWISVDDNFLGAYELPARFPVLASGKHHVKVYAGVKKNGIAATRVSYQYYQPIEKDLVFTPDSTVKAGVLHTTYYSTTKFMWREDFEEVAVSFDTINGSSAYIVRTPPGVPETFEGVHSGLVALDTVSDYFEVRSHSTMTIPAASVWLEMNFNCSNPFDVGVITYGNTISYQTPVITLNTTNGQWKKIYIDLSTTLNAYTGMQTFRVYLRALKISGQNSTRILFDNFKVLTRTTS